MSSIFCFYDQIPLGSPEKKRLYATQAPSIAGGAFACSARVYGRVLHVVKKELNLVEGYDMIA